MCQSLSDYVLMSVLWVMKHVLVTGFLGARFPLLLSFLAVYPAPSLPLACFVLNVLKMSFACRAIQDPFFHF